MGKHRRRVLAAFTASLTLLGAALLPSATATAALHGAPTALCFGPRLLPDLGRGSATIAVNRHGLVGGFVVGDDGLPHAAVWRDGVLQPRFDSGYQVSFTSDVNDRGMILWQGRLPDGELLAWLTTRHRSIRLQPPAGTTIQQVRRLDERGDVVGTVLTASEVSLAVRWDAPHYRARLLPPLPGDTESNGHGISDSRVSVGSSQRNDEAPPSPVRWDRRGDVHVLPALGGGGEAWVSDDAGEAAGYGVLGTDPGQQHALFWTRGYRLVDLGGLPGTNISWAFGMSQRGWVVGYSQHVNENGDVLAALAWVWPHHGGLVPLPTPPGQQSIAHDVTESGLVVGAVGPDVGSFALQAATWTCAP